MACIEPGDEILSSECTFSEYEFVAHVTGASFIKAPMKNHAYDIKAMIHHLSPKTKIIFIANPNNPTGTYVSESDIISLLDATSPTTMVVLDEAYAEYVDAEDYPDSLELIKSYPNLMITRTFSKIYGLANLRIGYGIAQSKVVKQVQKVRQPFNVNGLALECANEALKNDTFVQKSIETNQSGKTYLLNELNRLDCLIPPSQGNFLYVEFNKIDGVKLAQDLLKQVVIIRSMKSFGQNNAIRVTIGTQNQNEIFIKELHRCLKKQS